MNQANVRNILVLGATSAIAQAVMRRLANSQTSFLLIARNEKQLGTISRDLVVRGAKNADVMVADLSAAGESSVIPAAIERLNGRIDHVLVAYGALGVQEQASVNSDVASGIIGTNFTSVVRHLVALTPFFTSQGSGAITVLSSVAGDRGRQSNYIYGSAKAGLTVFLQGLRNRLYSSGVRVVCIKAGFVDTPMTKDFKKGLLWRTPDQVSRRIVCAMNSYNRDLYVPGFWHGIMLIIRSIPESLFIRLKL